MPYNSNSLAPYCKFLLKWCTFSITLQAETITAWRFSLSSIGSEKRLLYRRLQQLLAPAIGSMDNLSLSSTISCKKKINPYQVNSKYILVILCDYNAELVLICAFFLILICLSRTLTKVIFSCKIQCFPLKPNISKVIKKYLIIQIS